MIDLTARCDNRPCKHIFSDGEEVYCVDCFAELRNRIKELEEEIKELEREREVRE